MKTVLTIAGSDCSGGAGIQADIKTITAHRMYAMSAVTALTAQNTTGVYGIMDVEPEFLGRQLDCIFNDIFPDAVKIGMVSGRELIRTIVGRLGAVAVKNLVVDPVMISTSGCRLLADDALNCLIGQLIPLACLITPNIPEAEVLSGLRIGDADGMVAAAAEIARSYSGAILIKGGHNLNDANDLLYVEGRAQWFAGEHIDNPNTHGTGCTLSSAIACNLAAGCSLSDSVRRAKDYVSAALRANLRLGRGRGPLNHCHALTIKT